MPEGFGTGEIAHHLGHGHGGGARRGWSEQTIEILEALLLAIVAVATAWSGYQAARFDGRQAHLYGLSSKYRLLATQYATRGGQQQIYDTTTFDFWLQSTTMGDEKAAALFVKRFRPEYRPAFVAWMATNPFENPKAPAGPIVMPQYHNANLETSARWEAKASAAFETGTAARETGDKYLRNTVLLATVLFLTALAQRFKVRNVRLGLMGVSAVLLVVALYFVFTYPTA
ncbi:MAG: hypothetical protein ACXVZ2_07645 [Gaiellaceae bacterium]